MRKSPLIVLAILLAISASAQNDSESVDYDVLETWRCYNTYDTKMTKVLVSLTKVKGKKSGYIWGEVEVAGVTYDASFDVAGFDRRWDFSSSEGRYAFTIDLNGLGKYYDFSSPRNEHGVEWRQSFRCKSI